MGKWAPRLDEKTPTPPPAPTAKTDERGVLSVLTVTPPAGAREFELPPMRTCETAGAPKATDLAAVAWTDADIARLNLRRARLIRWGWPEAEAEKLADRLVRRDRDADDRVSCIDCRHYRPGQCGNRRRAGLNAPAVGRDLVAMLQRCPGFAELGASQPNEHSSWGALTRGPSPKAMTLRHAYGRHVGAATDVT